MVEEVYYSLEIHGFKGLRVIFPIPSFSNLPGIFIFATLALQSLAASKAYLALCHLFL
jgi:hypothetical protein